MTRLFGTDGVRGVANSELTCEIAFRLGQAAAAYLGPKIVIGKDTRRSGDMLEAAAAAGIMSRGGKALLAGVIPTPGVAFTVNDVKADGGMVISASHNPPEYNGIKLFDASGFKLPDDVEDAIEAYIAGDAPEASEAAVQNAEQLPTGAGVGTSQVIDNATDRYVEHVVESIRSQGVDFSGLHIALDAGHGASALTSGSAFEQLGARVTAINEDYSGDDINVGCGSTCLDEVKALVARTGADIGVAHDGDADRVMLVTPAGEVIDGDFMEALLAIDMKRRGVLAHDTVVSTVMCNLGFVKALEAEGIRIIQTKVGDRYVLEEMRAGGYNIGGEQSGHMILLDHNTTGDGLMTACQYIAAVRRSGMGVEEAARVMERYPQTLVNVRVTDKSLLDGNAAIAQAVVEAEELLAGDGRVLIRPSGTEPLVRVMVEAHSAELAEQCARDIAAVVESEL